MKQFTLRLDARQQRPVVALKNGLSALLDTGAYFPVWTDSEEVLVSGMGGTLVRKHVPFIGFGGITYGNLYQMTHKLNIILPQGESNVRNLKIEDKNGHLHVLCNSANE